MSQINNTVLMYIRHGLLDLEHARDQQSKDQSTFWRQDDWNDGFDDQLGTHNSQGGGNVQLHTTRTTCALECQHKSNICHVQAYNGLYQLLV